MVGASTDVEAEKSDFAPPHGAQRAIVPLTVQHSNESIRGDFLIIDDPPSIASEADVNIITTNARIEVGIWVEKKWDRALRMEANTTNASLEMGFVSSDERSSSSAMANK